MKSGAIIFPDDAELKEVVPFKATHDWTLTAQHPEPIVERLEVTEIDVSNVTRLDFERGKRDDDREPPDVA